MGPSNKHPSFPGHSDCGRMGWDVLMASASGYLGVIQSLILLYGKWSIGSGGGKGKKGDDSHH